MKLNKDSIYINKIYNIFTHKIPIYGNKNFGKINLMSGDITRNTSDYMFSIPFRLEKYIQKISGWDIPNVADTTLQEPAKIFGFFTIGKIMKSDIWLKEIADLLETERDWFSAAITLLNTMGYGYYDIISYMKTPQKINITVKLRESIEAMTYRRWYGKSSTPKCNFSSGVLSSIATLIYVANIKSKPDLSIDFYEYCFFDEIKEIKCREVSCIAQKLSNSSGCTFIIEK